MKRHGFDPISLVFGAAFVLLGLVLLDSDVDVTSLSGGSLLPLPLLLVGLLFLAVGLNRLRSDERGWATAEVAERADVSAAPDTARAGDEGDATGGETFAQRP